MVELLHGEVVHLAVLHHVGALHVNGHAKGPAAAALALVLNLGVGAVLGPVVARNRET